MAKKVKKPISKPKKKGSSKKKKSGNIFTKLIVIIFVIILAFFLIFSVFKPSGKKQNIEQTKVEQKVKVEEKKAEKQPKKVEQKEEKTDKKEEKKIAETKAVEKSIKLIHNPDETIAVVGAVEFREEGVEPPNAEGIDDKKAEPFGGTPAILGNQGHRIINLAARLGEAATTIEAGWREVYLLFNRIQNRAEDTSQAEHVVAAANICAVADGEGVVRTALAKETLALLAIRVLIGTADTLRIVGL